MKLTICLQTMGREKYLDQILRSFEGALLDPLVSVVILDNGAPNSVSQRLKVWQENKPDAIRVIRLEENDSRQSGAWHALFSGVEDWVIFPSDDDEFRPEIIMEWQSALTRNPNLVAFASAAAVMDEAGALTGEVRRPALPINSSKIEQISTAFHEPPFHWPSLFFRRSKLPLVLPNSRFAFDWWVGIHLLLAGEVQVTDSIGINYRVHSEQESVLAPLRRKYFEAQVWLEDILRGNQFGDWFHTLNDASKLELWNRMNVTKPIYGDLFFSKSIIEILYKQLLPTMKYSESAIQMTDDYALSHGVLLRDGETKHLMQDFLPLNLLILGNVRLEVDFVTCEDIQVASTLIRGSESATIFRLYCGHSLKRSNGFKFDCSKLHHGDAAINADLIINELTSYFEKRNDFELTLTGGERIMVSILRKWKHRLPKYLKRSLIHLKKKI